MPEKQAATGAGKGKNAIVIPRLWAWERPRQDCSSLAKRNFFIRTAHDARALLHAPLSRHARLHCDGYGRISQAGKGMAQDVHCLTPIDAAPWMSFCINEEESIV